MRNIKRVVLGKVEIGVGLVYDGCVTSPSCDIDAVRAPCVIEFVLGCM
jgi:hypothetical protein